MHASAAPPSAWKRSAGVWPAWAKPHASADSSDGMNLSARACTCDPSAERSGGGTWALRQKPTATLASSWSLKSSSRRSTAGGALCQTSSHGSPRPVRSRADSACTALAMARGHSSWSRSIRPVCTHIGRAASASSAVLSHPPACFSRLARRRKTYHMVPTASESKVLPCLA